MALTFIARTRTPANILTSPVLNLFPIKLHGFDGAFKICSTKKLLDNQMDILESFMSWNSWNFLINKLKLKYKSSPSTTIATSDADLPIVWVHLPHFGECSESLVKPCISKIQHYLQNPIKFIII